MKRVKHSFIFSSIVVLFILFCLMTIVKLQIEVNRISDQNKALKQDISDIRYQNDEIKNELSKEKDEDYYIEKGREKLNLRLPEEIIFYNDLINNDN